MTRRAALTIVATLLSAAAIAQDTGATDRAQLAADLLASTDAQAPPLPARARLTARRALDSLGVHPLDGSAHQRVAATPFRGRVLGPAWQRGWLPAGGEARLEQQFMGGQRATIAVAGAPAAPLTLTVAEPGVEPVCRDAPRACRWLPLYTQRYAITLRNPGAARVRFYLVLD